jgi:hypothetical protein
MYQQVQQHSSVMSCSAAKVAVESEGTISHPTPRLHSSIGTIRSFNIEGNSNWRTPESAWRDLFTLGDVDRDILPLVDLLPSLLSSPPRFQTAVAKFLSLLARSCFYCLSPPPSKLTLSSDPLSARTICQYVQSFKNKMIRCVKYQNKKIVLDFPRKSSPGALCLSFCSRPML